MVKPRSRLRKLELRPEERTELYRQFWQSELGEAVLLDLQEIYKHRKYLPYIGTQNRDLVIYHAAKADLITEIENVILGVAPARQPANYENVED